ncbi:MAG: hypothetical protein ACO3A2_09405 [Bdellovibrionia bacterium]
MKDWIYLFSQFTSEALTLELAILLFLCASYGGFWVLKKRRFGVAQSHVPAGLVRVYLEELIGNANTLQVQLFGLKGSGGAHDMAHDLEASLGSRSKNQGELVQRLLKIEEKLELQSKALENLVTTGVPLQAQSSQPHGGANAAPSQTSPAAQASAPAPSAPAGGGDTALLEKISVLEKKLAEYSIIEDDLADLKKIQQENAQLKSTLADLHNRGLIPADVAPPADSASGASVHDPLAKPQAQESVVPEAAAAPVAPSPGDAELLKEFEKMLQG